VGTFTPPRERRPDYPTTTITRTDEYAAQRSRRGFWPRATTDRFRRFQTSGAAKFLERGVYPVSAIGQK
jgi:hypothetical protein